MVRSSCRNHYQLEVFSAILSHLISPKAMADVSHATPKLIANIGKLATIIFERVMANEWQSSELNVIQLLSLLRQVIDDSGTIYPLAETAFGAAFIRPTVEALFKSVNGIMLLTLSRAHANLEYVVQAVSLKLRITRCFWLKAIKTSNPFRYTSITRSLYTRLHNVNCTNLDCGFGERS